MVLGVISSKGDATWAPSQIANKSQDPDVVQAKPHHLLGEGGVAP